MQVIIVHYSLLFNNPFSPSYTLLLDPTRLHLRAEATDHAIMGFPRGTRYLFIVRIFEGCIMMVKLARQHHKITYYDVTNESVKICNY